MLSLRNNYTSVCARSHVHSIAFIIRFPSCVKAVMSHLNDSFTYEVGVTGNGNDGINEEVYQDMVETILIFARRVPVRASVAMTITPEASGDESSLNLLRRNGTIFLVVIKRQFTVIFNLADVHVGMRSLVMDLVEIQRL